MLNYQAEAAAAVFVRARACMTYSLGECRTGSNGKSVGRPGRARGWSVRNTGHSSRSALRSVCALVCSVCSVCNEIRQHKNTMRKSPPNPHPIPAVADG